jgi:hypothetical protein
VRELQALAASAAAAHFESARHYAQLGMGDWMAVDGEGRVTFPVGEPTQGDVVMATPLTMESTKSTRTLKDALLAGQRVSA